jgi:hypothetical protein
MRKLIPMLCVTDVRRTVADYESLGFTVTERHPEHGDLEFAVLSLGAVEIMVQPLGNRPHDRIALWFYTERIDDFYDRVRREGLAREILEEVYEPFYGGRQFSIIDRNGFELVFYSP